MTLTIKKNIPTDKIRPKENTPLLLKKASTKEIMFPMYHVPPFQFKYKANHFGSNFINAPAAVIRQRLRQYAARASLLIASTCLAENPDVPPLPAQPSIADRVEALKKATLALSMILSSQRAAKRMTATGMQTSATGAPPARKLSDENGLSFWAPAMEGPDYQALLKMIAAGMDKLNEVKRFDMPGFRPRMEYLSEMKRYGLLPPTFDVEKDHVDPYEMDRRYWDSFIYQPAREERPARWIAQCFEVEACNSLQEIERLFFRMREPRVILQRLI